MENRIGDKKVYKKKFQAVENEMIEQSWCNTEWNLKISRLAVVDHTEASIQGSMCSCFALSFLCPCPRVKLMGALSIYVNFVVSVLLKERQIYISKIEEKKCYNWNARLLNCDCIDNGM